MKNKHHRNKRIRTRTRSRQPKLKVLEVKLGREQAAGMADYENQQILVDPRLRPYDYFNTMVHELIHHIAPSWDESKVNWWAGRLAKFLWRQNYRQVKQ